MARAAIASVDEYLSNQLTESRASLDRVRAAIRKVPRAEETISYGIPTYRVDGAVVLYFAGWKKHYSLYPVNDELVAEFRNELAPYDLEKATLRFPLSEPVPVRLIECIAKFRAGQVAAKKR